MGKFSIYLSVFMPIFIVSIILSSNQTTIGSNFANNTIQNSNTLTINLQNTIIKSNYLFNSLNATNTITIHESNLPNNITWYIENSRNKTINAIAPNSIYIENEYNNTIIALNISYKNFTYLPYKHYININNFSNINISYYKMYKVKLIEQGIPHNSTWYIYYYNQKFLSSNNSISINVIQNNYSISVPNITINNITYSHVNSNIMINSSTITIINFTNNSVSKFRNNSLINKLNSKTNFTINAAKLSKINSTTINLIKTNATINSSNTTNLIIKTLNDYGIYNGTFIKNKTNLFNYNKSNKITNNFYISKQSFIKSTNNSSITRYSLLLNNTIINNMSSVNESKMDNFIKYVRSNFNGVRQIMISLKIAYGYIKQHNVTVSAGDKLNFISYNNSTITYYNLNITKLQPKLTITVNGDNFSTPNETTYMYIPIIKKSSYNLSISLNGQVQQNNSLIYNYSIIFSNGTRIHNTSNYTVFKKILNLTVKNLGRTTIQLETTGNNNYTAVDPTLVVVPVSILHYVPITITNLQTISTSAPFQDMLTVNSLQYKNYESGNLANVEFFYQNGTIVPSWLEGSASNTSLNIAGSTNLNKSSNTIYWLNISNGIKSSSYVNIYMGFASINMNLFNSGSNGEAPQLSSTYAQYDDGSNVFLYYNVNPTSTTGWSISGSSGQTLSAPSGSHYSNTNAYYASSAPGDYMYKSINKLTSNVVITFDVYSNGLGNLFFLTNNGGAGQMVRLDTRKGGAYSGLATTNSWTSWAAPTSGLDENPNTWYKYDVVLSGTIATAYIGSILNNIISLGTKTNQLSLLDNGNYIGLVGDGLGSTYKTYWNGITIRAYPPNGVMPIASMGAIVGVSGIPDLIISPPIINYGNTSTITATANPNTDYIALFMNGNLIDGPITGTITYLFNSISAENGAGTYMFNAFDENSLNTSISTLTVNKLIPNLTLPEFPNSTIYTGTPSIITAEMNTINNQISANYFVNGINKGSFNNKVQISESNPNNYHIIANTLGNSNYTNASVSNMFDICPEISSAPLNITEYACISLENNQTIATSNPYQDLINISESKFKNLITYNGTNSNFEFFYSNGTIIPSWIEGNNSGNISIWVKIDGMPALSSTQIYIGFASNNKNLLNNVTTGEAPQLSSVYAQYDDGSNVFLNYFSGNSIINWNINGVSGKTSTAPSGNQYFGTHAFYANGANGDYLYTIAQNQSTSMLIEFYGYTQNLQDLYFLSDSSGAAQIFRDGSGSGWYGIAPSSSWTLWAAPPDTGIWSNEWVTMGIVVNNKTVIGYLKPGVNPYGTELGANPTNKYTFTNNGNYIGLVGDAAGSSTIQYWSGIMIRTYPPNGIMPTFDIGEPKSLVSFVESGLPNFNESWNVTYNNLNYNVIVPNSIVFTDTPGNYLFNIPNQTIYGMRYIPNPSTGYISTGNQILITFTKFQNICTISLNKNTINFGNFNPGSTMATSDNIIDTNTGNSNAYIYIFGSNWSSGFNSFGVSNTSHSNYSGITFVNSDKLTSTATNTMLIANAGLANIIYFGLNIPKATPSGIYAQTITIENSC